MLVNHPSQSLGNGTWFKLICGASLHHLASVRNLAFVFTAAGVDCIDMAADPAVVRAVRRGMSMALEQVPEATPPWLMASFNDGEDPHFRKAIASSSQCPSTCPQPCIDCCPPTAIAATITGIAIQSDLCFGCGRCEPLCPPQIIQSQHYRVSVESQMPKLVDAGIEAIEIHTRIGREREFAALWQQLQPWIDSLQLVSVSFNDGDGLEDYLRNLVSIVEPQPRRLIWQVDGRPMSGDIGKGTTRATLRLAQKVISLQLPGFVQLAGGTNQATMRKARELGIAVAGAGFGSYARKLVQETADIADLDCHSPVFSRAIELARELVLRVKQSSAPLSPAPANATIAPHLHSEGFAHDLGSV